MLQSSHLSCCEPPFLIANGLQWAEAIDALPGAPEEDQGPVAVTLENTLELAQKATHCHHSDASCLRVAFIFSCASTKPNFSFFFLPLFSEVGAACIMHKDQWTQEGIVHCNTLCVPDSRHCA